MSEAYDLPEYDESSAAELARREAGPKRTTTLRSRRSPLEAPSHQIRTLESVDLREHAFGGDFAQQHRGVLPRPQSEGKTAVPGGGTQSRAI